MTTGSSGTPFRPSWIDDLNRWAQGLRLRPWLVDLLLGGVLILAQLLFLWLDSGSLANELLPVIFFNSLAVPYLLAMIRLLDQEALSALKSMRPVLKLPPAELPTVQFRIAHMPFLAPLLAGLAMTLFAILLPLVAAEPERYAVLDQLSLFTLLFHIIDKSSAFLFGVVIYHTIRQLRLVNAINTNDIHINIFQLRPVQSFSRLTAATALALLIFFYGWIVINPELLADPAILVVSLLFTALAVLVFVWPLWSLHRLMVVEKERSLREIELQFELLFGQFNRHIAAADYAAAEKLNGTIMSLEIQHNKVNAMPTWPWRSDTVRFVLTAIALPVMLMIIQFLIQPLLSP